KITSVWGNHEGVMRLWVLILALFGALVAGFGFNLPTTLKARVLSVQSWIACAFYLFILITSNPFLRLPQAPFEGRDLNPILQDNGLAIHPPLLYLGYVGFSIAFSFAVAALGALGAPMDACSVDFPDRWHRYGLLLGLLRARLGRILVLGSGGERVADAVAGRHGAAAFGCGDGKAQRIENLDPAAGDPCVLFVPDRHLLGAVGGAHVRACFCQRPSTRRVYSGHPGAFHRRWFDAVCLARANAKGGRAVRSDLARGRSRRQQPLPDNCLPHRFCWHTLSFSTRGRDR